MVPVTFSRKARRCGVRIDASLMRRCDDRSRGATLVELSRTGARMRGETLPVGEQLVVAFALPSRRQEILVFGEVVRATDEGCAVAFLDLPAGAGERIDRLARARGRRWLGAQEPG